jgi:hypothetical protein
MKLRLDSAAVMLVTAIAALAATATSASAMTAAHTGMSAVSRNDYAGRDGAIKTIGVVKVVSGGIESRACSSSTATWVHVDTTEGTFCIGFTGTIYFTLPEKDKVLAFCAGNNYGNFTAKQLSGIQYFYPGHVNYWNICIGNCKPGINMGQVTITGWGGNNQC